MRFIAPIFTRKVLVSDFKVSTDIFKPSDAIGLSSIRRVLVIKFRNLGDVLISSPVFTVLRRELSSDAVIDALVYDGATCLLDGHLGIDHLYGVNSRRGGIQGIKENIKWIKLIRSNQYDLVINLTEGDRGAIVALFSSATYRVGLHHRKNTSIWWKRAAYTHFYKTDLSRRHAVEQGLDSLRRIGVRVLYKSVPLSIYVSDGEYKTARLKLSKLGWKNDPYVLLHPTSRWFFKCLSQKQIANIIEIISGYGLKVVLVCGPGDREHKMFNQIVDVISTEIYSFPGVLSLKEVAALIQGARLFVGADSVGVHMAAALQTPSIVWYGPTNENVWRPWLSKHEILKQNLQCRPCELDGCGGGKISECLWGIQRDQIVKSVRNILSKI